MKAFLQKLFARFLNSNLVINNPYVDLLVLQEHINEVNIKQRLRHLSLGTDSKLYEQSRIFNFQNDKAKITLGINTHIRAELLIFPYGGEIKIGNNCYIGENSRIWSAQSIIIGNGVLIAHNVNIIDTNSHELNSLEREQSFIKMTRNGHPKYQPNVDSAKVIIEDRVWINFNVVVSKGIHIGEGAIIAPNTVVSQNVPAYCLFAGVPGQVIKKLSNETIN